jgi:Domain of unknown function (DUF5668)
MNNEMSCEEMVMNGNTFQSRPSDTVIGVVIALIGTLVLLSRLHVVQMGFNLPGDLVRWWPLLLVYWGLALLLMPAKARR